MGYRRDDFILWMIEEKYREVTIDDYDRRLRRVFKEIDLETIPKVNLLMWLMDQEKRRGKTAVNHDVKAINAYFRFIRRDITLKTWKVRSVKKIYIPTDEDIEKIFKFKWKDPAITARNQLIIRYAFLALRRSEIAKLNISDVSESEIHIRDSKMNVSRTIPMPIGVWELTKEYIRFYRIPSDAHALFTSTKGRISSKTIGDIFLDLKKSLGIPIHPHSCRHWRAVDLYRKGVDLEAIRRYLGHASLETTQRYLRALLESITMEQIYEKDDLFGGYKIKGGEKPK